MLAIGTSYERFLVMIAFHVAVNYVPKFLCKRCLRERKRPIGTRHTHTQSDVYTGREEEREVEENTALSHIDIATQFKTRTYFYLLNCCKRRLNRCCENFSDNEEAFAGTDPVYIRHV